MHYQNPVIRGFYPDPSVCAANGKYYLVCSTMPYSPGVPVFESDDLLSWTQVGHCLTRHSQVDLTGVTVHGGVFAPTIRFHEGRFYMVTTNSTLGRHFYVSADDVRGEWSEPICVDQNGIDPTLFFEDGRTWFLSNGSDDDGVAGIVLSEINLQTGERLTARRTIWQGTGGRYLEGPHLYHIGDWYYLLCAEGGTEYGHMVTLARAKAMQGPYESCPDNPILTNRNLGGYPAQGVGHGDLIRDARGDWWLLHLGFRQTSEYGQFHHLGREVFLTPAHMTDDGWFALGEHGTARLVVETDRFPEGTRQRLQRRFTFADTPWNLAWAYLRHPHAEHYELTPESAVLHGTSVTLDDVDSPTFIGLRQRDFEGTVRVRVAADRGEAGLTFFMDERHHYDLALRRSGDAWDVLERLNIGDTKAVVHSVSASSEVTLAVRMSALQYEFALERDGQRIVLGTADTRYLSSEVAGGFTGVMIGLYAVGGTAVFTDFCCEYTD